MYMNASSFKLGWSSEGPDNQGPSSLDSSGLRSLRSVLSVSATLLFTVTLNTAWFISF